MRPQAYRSLLDQLSTLLESGIPILEALSTLGRSPHRSVAAAAERLRGRIQAGSPLREALAAEPAFPPAHVALIAAAERAGEVPKMLDRLRDEMDRSIAARRAMLQKSAYPMFLLAASFLLPPLHLLFEGRTGAYIVNELVLFGMVGGVMALGYALRRQARAGVASLPFLGAWIRNGALGESLSLLGLLVGAGIGVQEALEIAAGAARSPGLSDELRQAAQSLRSGENLTGALGSLTGMPPTALGIIATGEHSGTMDQALTMAGRELEDSTRISVGRFLAVLPYVIYLLVAGWIANKVITTMLGSLAGAGLGQ